MIGAFVESTKTQSARLDEIKKLRQELLRRIVKNEARRRAAQRVAAK
jgi:hypothetical protein